MKQLTDNYGRRHDYLRISITDRCNLRCMYCMGPQGVKQLAHEDILTYEEILKVVQCGAKMGISKIRVTGGEPLIRKNLACLIEGIAGISGIEDISMTTNGILLEKYAGELKRAGLQRINISLDTLKEGLYKNITRGGELHRVFEGIESALEYGFQPLKLNVVLMKGFNEKEVPDFLDMALKKEIHVRFIEYMPIGNPDDDYENHYLPLSYILESAESAGYKLTPIKHPLGAGPAEYYTFKDNKGSIGLIHSISNHFCSSCNRLRLTADGRLKACLYWQEEEYVRPLLDEPDKLTAKLQEVIKRKPREHMMGEKKDPKAVNPCKMRAMSRTGG